MFCEACGSRVNETNKFCGSCGAPVAGPAAYGQSGPAVDAPFHGAPVAVPARKSFSAEEFFGGDWPGALRIAAIGVGAMFVLSAIGVLLLTGAHRGVGLNLALTAAVTALSVGGSMTGGFALPVFSAFGLGSLSVLPLTVTLAGLGLVSVLFVRRLRATGPHSGPQVVLEGLRIAVVFLALLLVVTLLGRHKVGGDQFSNSFSTKMRTGVPDTLFFGAVLLGVALLIGVVVGLPGVLSAQLQHWRSAIAAPAIGAVTALTVATAATGLWALFEIATHGGKRQALGGLVLGLPNAGAAALLFGGGVPVNGTGTAMTSSTKSFSILDATDGSAVWWLLPIGAALALVTGALVAALRAPDFATARRNGYRFGAVWPLVSLAVALLTAVSVAGNVGGEGASASAHFGYLLAVVFGVVWGTLAGIAGPLLAVRLPAGLSASLRARLHAPTLWSDAPTRAPQATYQQPVIASQQPVAYPVNNPPTTEMVMPPASPFAPPEGSSPDAPG